jgi:ketosteroid isomerase-like protein
MRRLLLALAVLCVALPIATQAPASPDNPDRKAIEAAMATQVAAWNHADIPGFMQVYENSADTTFIGAHVAKGFTPILERYKANYSTAKQMGALTFTNLDVRLLPSTCGKVEFAVVTGNFHLERTAKGAATKDDGTFSLVWRKGAQGWKILLDHTS